MAVNRIVPNVRTEHIDAPRAFYADLLGMTEAMDHGWIVTFVGSGTAKPQISFAIEGGSGTPVPDISVEVDDVNAVFARAVSVGHEIAYALTDEPWGVRRFFLRDPAGNLVNILQHTG